MSYHVTNPELEAKLAAQRRNSTIMSIMIALLLCVLMALGLTLVLMSPLFKEEPKVVTYAPEVAEELITEVPQEVTEQVERKPAAPSSSMAKVIASASASPVAVPVPDIDVAAPSLDFGDVTDFGDGWGDDAGKGSAGATVSFFQQKIEANNIAYVIDYSRSMGSKKQALMKAELTKSIKKLPSGIQYSLIFFAGPAWLPGAKVTELSKTKWEIEQNGKSYIWSKEGQIYTSKPEQPRVEWIDSTSANRRDSIKIVESSGLEFGTSWYTPLEMALKMKPQPDVVFLMTDGLAGGTEQVVEELGEYARKRKIVVNTIAINEPRARESMTELAKKTKGQFSLVDEDGKVIVQDK